MVLLVRWLKLTITGGIPKRYSIFEDFENWSVGDEPPKNANDVNTNKMGLYRYFMGAGYPSGIVSDTKARTGTKSLKLGDDGDVTITDPLPYQITIFVYDEPSVYASTNETFWFLRRNTVWVASQSPPILFIYGSYSNYYYEDCRNDQHDTGIARIAGWVGFRFKIYQGKILSYISVDGGITWTCVGGDALFSTPIPNCWWIETGAGAGKYWYVDDIEKISYRVL
jgi:hypothetical protein